MKNLMMISMVGLVASFAVNASAQEVQEEAKEITAARLSAEQTVSEQPPEVVPSINSSIEEVPFDWGLAGAQIVVGVPMEIVGLWLGYQSAMLVYDGCNQYDITWDSSWSSTACILGIILAFRGVSLATTTTVVWSVGELAGYDGSWLGTLAGAFLFGTPGAIYTYQSSMKLHRASLSANPLDAPNADTMPILRFSF